MDSESELAQMKWVLLCGALVLLSCVISYEEPIYLVAGRDAQATVTEVKDDTRRTGMLEQRKSTNTVVRYTYTESNGSERTGSDRFPGYGPDVGIGSKVAI